MNLKSREHFKTKSFSYFVLYIIFRPPLPVGKKQLSGEGGSSRFAELSWTDPGLKSEIGARELIST